MMPTNTPSTQPSASKEDEKTRKSLQSLTSLMTLSAILSVGAGLFIIWRALVESLGVVALLTSLVAFTVAGVMFWCVRRLDQKKKSGFVIFTSFTAASLFVTLIFRMLFSDRLFHLTDLASFLLPAAIIFELYKLVKKGVLT